MFRFAHRPRFLVAVLCVAVIALRAGGVHLHLCMDGSEPPLSFHVADSGIHHLDQGDAGEEHADRDMSIASDVVVKKSGDFELSLLAAFFALLLFMLARPRERLVFNFLPAQVRSVRNRLRPPLRGPPRLA